MDSERIDIYGQADYELFRKVLLPDGVGRLKRLKFLGIWNCDDTEECLANAPATIVFPILEKLFIYGLPNLREICHGPVIGGSFGELTTIDIRHCNRLENLFELQIVGCLTQLNGLTIKSCAMMKEVIWKEQRDAHIATNGIEFRKLELLDLDDLPSLVGFYGGVDQIDFPKLKHMYLGGLNQFNRLFGIKSTVSSSSEQNYDVGFLSLFPQKVIFPCLEGLLLTGLNNVSHEYYIELLISSYPTLKKLEVRVCNSLRYVFHSSVAVHLLHLEELNISNCSKMEAVVDWEEEIEDGQERKVDTTLFPHLRNLRLNNLPNLRRFCHFTHTLELPMLSKLHIRRCPSMEGFSVGHVSTPNLSLPNISLSGSRIGYLNYISWNGDLNNALSLLQEKGKKEERERFAGVEEDLQGLHRVADDDIDDYSLDSDEFFKKREKVETVVKEFIGRLKARTKKRKREVADVEYGDGRDDDIHEHLEDSDEMEPDSCDYESDGSIERNNIMINWRETLPPNPQRGPCICFRTADLYTDASVITRFYSVPFDFFGDGGGDDDVNSSNPNVEGLKRFYECTDFATTSSLSSVGSSLFVIGGRKETGPCRVSIATEEMYRFDTTAPENGWYKRDELRMLTPRAFPITVAMDGKLYIFGGSGPESPDAPLAEMFNPCSGSSTCESLPRPPSFQFDGWRHLVVAALQPSKKILVASGLSDVVAVYNVEKRVWEELDHKVDFSFVRGQAAVVQNGSALCWCSNNVEEVHTYDLVHKRWFKSPIKGLDKIGMRDPDGPMHYCPIFPLDDNHLCLLWKDHMGHDGTNLPLLHCIKIQVSIDEGGSRFDAKVVASRTYALGQHESIFDAHVFLRDDDEGGERSSGLSGHDNGGKTRERRGYGGGRQIVSSFPPCSKCWGTGHTGSRCDQVVGNSGVTSG